MQLEVGKQYKSRNGTTFTIIKIKDNSQIYPVIAECRHGFESFTLNGKFYLNHQDHNYDLIEEVLPEPKTGDMILVGNGLGVWTKRELIGFNTDGQAICKIYANENKYFIWDNWKPIPPVEEQKAPEQEAEQSIHIFIVHL